MPLDPASYTLAKKALFMQLDWNSIVNKPSTFPPSTHASSHEYGGSDLIHNLDYLAVRGTTVINSNRNIVNVDNITASGSIYPASDNSGSLGILFYRWSLARILRLEDINYAKFNATAAPDLVGKLAFDPADNRLKFHDGTEAQAIAWCDPKALITYILKGAAIFFTEDGYGHVYAFPTTYADESVQGVTGYNTSQVSSLVARLSDLSNYYRLYIDNGQSTADFRLDKVVAGTVTNLGYEAVDLSLHCNYTIKLVCASSQLSAYRTDMTTPKFSIADTSFASGYFGAGNLYYSNAYQSLPLLFECKLGSALQPVPEATHYFEVPVIGSGTNEDPFRPQMPEEIRFTSEEAKRKYDFLKTAGFTDNEINTLLPGLIQKVNLQALNVSSLIKTGKDGKPAEYTAIVRIMPQPDRPPHLKPISECVEALKRIPDAKQLTSEQAVKKALEIDDKIHIYDLKANPHPAKKDIDEYIQWRKNSHGVEMPEAKAEAYIKTPKGWG
jgi:hypothetical protein